MSNKVNQNLIPVELTREEYNALCGAGNYPFGRIRIGARVTTGILIPAESEEQFNSIIRGRWNEEKSEERRCRCMARSEKKGKLIRCESSCEKCGRKKDNQPLSLDLFDGKNRPELPDPRQSLGYIETEYLFEQLLGLLEQQASGLAVIFRELYEGAGQRETERMLGIPHSTMTDMVGKMRSILQKYVTREDITG